MRFFSKLRRLTYITAVSLLFVPLALAEQNLETSFPACVGFDSATNSFGWRDWATSKNNPQAGQRRIMRTCPPHTVFYGTTMGSGQYGPSDAPIDANCCPLPEQDILTDEHVEAISHCPDNFVVTGVTIRLKCGSGKECERPIRCTRINTDRYQLGSEQPGVFWGASVKASFPWKEDKKIRVDELPLAIRYGVQRSQRRVFALAGCVGEPPGSLLVAKNSVRCKGFRYRELQYRGVPGDAPKGTAVKMFPECDKIDTVFASDAKCYR